MKLISNAEQNKEFQLDPPSSCSETFTDSQIVAVCNTCSFGRNAPICIKCYLNGDHFGHDVYFQTVQSGNCKCGDCCAMGSKCFCSEHKIKEMKNEVSRDLINLLSLAFDAIQIFATRDDLICTQLVKALITLAQRSNDITSALYILFTKKNHLARLFLNWPRFIGDAPVTICELFSILCSLSPNITQPLATAFARAYKPNISYFSHMVTEIDPDHVALQCSYFFRLGQLSWEKLADFPQAPYIIADALSIATSLLAYNLSHPFLIPMPTVHLFDGIRKLFENKVFLKTLSSLPQVADSIFDSITLVDAQPSIWSFDMGFTSDHAAGAVAFHLFLSDFKSLVELDLPIESFFRPLVVFAKRESFIEGGMVFDKSTVVSPFLEMHEIAFTKFCKLCKGDAREQWSTLCHKLNQDYEGFLKETTILPIRAIAFWYLNSLGLINTEGETDSFTHIIQFIRDSIKGSHFLAAECAMGLTKNPEEMMQQIAAAFGIRMLFKDTLLANISAYLYCFAYFLLACICDDFAALDEEKELYKTAIRRVLRMKTIPCDQMTYLYNVVKGEKLLKEIGNTFYSDGILKYQSYDKLDFSIYETPREFLSHFPNIFLTHRGARPYGFNVEQVLNTPTFFAILFATGSENERNPLKNEVHLTIRILLRYVPDGDPPKQEYPPIEAETIDELAVKLTGLSFAQFKTVPISFKDRKLRTFADFNITTLYGNPESAKASVLQHIHQQSNYYLNNQTTSIFNCIKQCNDKKNQFWVLPVYPYHSELLGLIDEFGGTSLQLSSVQFLTHQQCKINGEQALYLPFRNDSQNRQLLDTTSPHLEQFLKTVKRENIVQILADSITALEIESRIALIDSQYTTLMINLLFSIAVNVVANPPQNKKGGVRLSLRKDDSFTLFVKGAVKIGFAATKEQLTELATSLIGHNKYKLRFMRRVNLFLSMVFKINESIFEGGIDFDEDPNGELCLGFEKHINQSIFKFNSISDPENFYLIGNEAYGVQVAYKGLNIGEAAFVMDNKVQYQVFTPFVNKVGMEDVGLKKGRELFLDQERMIKLFQCMINGSFVIPKRFSLLPDYTTVIKK